MKHTELIERLRKEARNDSVFGDDVRAHASEQAADAIESLQAERDALKLDAELYLTALKEITDYTYKTSYCGAVKNIACRCNSDCPIAGILVRCSAAMKVAA